MAVASGTFLWSKSCHIANVLKSVLLKACSLKPSSQVTRHILSFLPAAEFRIRVGRTHGVLKKLLCNSVRETRNCIVLFSTCMEASLSLKLLVLFVVETWFCASGSHRFLGERFALCMGGAVKNIFLSSFVIAQLNQYWVNNWMNELPESWVVEYQWLFEMPFHPSN